MTLVEKLARPRPLIMGILNVTPDSFSDGGAFLDADKAVEHGLRMAAEGADIIDVGGESTRPGALRVGVGDQVNRTRQIVERLRAVLPPAVTVSIDTTLPEVAEAALGAGAGLINDISGGGDPGMLELAAARKIPIVLMHMQGTPATMQQNPIYVDVVAEVETFLIAAARAALKAGVGRDRILIDPGIGFGKAGVHNLALMAGLSRLAAHGWPVLLGTSRKRFMGSICNETQPRDLLGATCATTAMGVAAGVRVFRVHDVKANRQAADVAWAICHEHGP
jgi:dihydropteroate synthase